MKKQDKKKKSSPGKLVYMLFSLIIGAVAGLFMAEYIFNSDKNQPLAPYMTELFFTLAFIIFGVYFNLIVHEAGHLVFGLLTGYKFCSFRVFSLTWIKKDGKIKFKKYSLAGTGGQCLMSPPDMKKGKFPVILYNLGGVFINLITTAVFMLLYFLLKEHESLASYMLIIAVTALLTALTNGIPMKAGNINNDGHNAISISRNKDSMKAFWLQLKIHNEQAEGKRLKDLPQEWFEYPSEEKLKNSMTAATAVFCCNRMLDEQDFDKANETMTKLLDSDAAIIDVHRYLLLCDRIYCEIINGRTDEASKLVDKNLKKFIKSMKNTPSVMRTEYALALFAERDTQKAEKIYSDFQKRLSTYPYTGDAELEKDLVERLKTLYNKSEAHDKTTDNSKNQSVRAAIKKSKEKSSNYLPTVLFLITIGLCIFICIENTDMLSFSGAALINPPPLFYAFVLYFAAFFIQRIVSTAGDFLFGRLCGYSFYALRFYGLLFIKEKGKIIRKGSQKSKKIIKLYMLPPETNEQSYPVIPFILGSAITNLISSGFFLLFYILSYNIPFLSVFMLVTAVIGFYFAVYGLLPFGMGENAGKSALYIKKYPEAVHYANISLKININLEMHKSLKDMPDEWFELPSKEKLTPNPYISLIGAYACERYMDKRCFDKAADIADMLIESGCTKPEYTYYYIVANKIYCELIRENTEQAKEFINCEYIAYSEAHSESLAFLRTKYAYTVICENNSLKAEQIKVNFEKACAKNIHSYAVQTETKLMELADMTAYKRGNKIIDEHQ